MKIGSENQNARSIGTRLALGLVTLSPILLIFAILSLLKGPVSYLMWSLLFFLAGFSGVIIVVRKEIPSALGTIRGKSAVTRGYFLIIVFWFSAAYFLIDYLW